MPLEFEFQDEGLVEAIANLPKAAQEAVIETVKATTRRGEEIVKFKTPVDSGDAINGWQHRFENGGEVGILFNDVAYINVLEFGGYPVKPKWHARTNESSLGYLFGDALLGGYPPGPRTQRAPGGDPVMRSNVSKQAPSGMVRSTLEEIEKQFLFDLSENLDKALA